MGALTPYQFVIWRYNCVEHMRKRAAARVTPMTAEQVEALGALADRFRPILEKPGQHRYWLKVRSGDGIRYRMLYDTDLSTPVTVIGRQFKVSKRNAPDA